VSAFSEMTYRSLDFLNAMPLTLFEDSPVDPIEYEEFFQENFAILINCLIDNDERIRCMASAVTKTLLRNGSVFLLHESFDKDSQYFPANFWRST
jgi:hypothetical protein